MTSDESVRDEGRLIEAIREQIRATPMLPARRPGLPRPTSPVARVRRPGWLAAAVVAVSVAIGTVVLSLGGTGSPPPAYAATLNADRTVTITLREMADIPKLNAKLTELRTRIRVVPVVRGCVAPVHMVSNGKVVPGPAQTLHAARLGGTLISTTIEVNTLPGRTLVVPDSKSGMYIGGAVVLGPAPPCVAYPAATGPASLIYAHP